MYPINLIVIGAGCRGFAYAEFSKQHPEKVRIVGVAEPKEFNRHKFAREFNIPAKNIVTDWQELAARKKFAAAVVIATPDKLHAGPASAFAEKGYHMLLEKPIAPTENECKSVVEAVLEHKIIFAVCHVLRYTAYTQKLKSLVDSGAIGEVASIQHLEPVGYWHYAHSYVRGNWRNEQESSFMLLSKSCHDLDWIRYIMAKPCLAVSSFGSLLHFRKENKPAGAAMRCLECGVEPDCPYSAKKIYLNRIRRGESGWPVDIITPILTEEGVLTALQNGLYGRCVYECDNDVVDHQVVNMAFEGDKTATFTMTAFTETLPRKTRIFGTHGELEGDGDKIHVVNFVTDKETIIQTNTDDHSITSGHGGGDYRLMKHFVTAVAEEKPQLILSGPKESLETHLMVFAAEKARLENRVVKLDLN